MPEIIGRPRGRPKGAKNKRTEAREQAMQEVSAAVAKTLEDAFEGDAHALLMAIYKDNLKPIELRIDAAKAAIRFEKPSLSSIEADVSLTGHEAALDALK